MVSPEFNLCTGNFHLGQVTRRVFPKGIAARYLCPCPASPAKVIMPASPALVPEIMRFILHHGEDLAFLVKPDVA